MSNAVTTEPDTVATLLQDTIDVVLTNDVVVSLKDTSLVSIVDAVTLNDLTPWWLNPGWHGLIIAVIAVLVSLWVAVLAYRAEKRAIKKEISSGWLDLTEHRMEFWEKISAAYKRWRTSYLEEKPDSAAPPANIESLIAVASLPPEIARIRSPLQYASTIESFLKQPNQQQIWEFATTVYPKDNDGHSTILGEDANAESENAKFDRARNELTLALDGWAEITKLDYITKRFRGDYLLVAMLAWLELALIVPLRGKWSYRASFFQLVQKLRP